MNLPLKFHPVSWRGPWIGDFGRGIPGCFPLLLVGLFVVASCAVPVPPTGGPPDQDPPTLMASQPEDGSVNQLVERVTFEFDERIDERSALPAISVTPEFEAPLRIRARGNRLTVEFPVTLRDNTTYIITLDSKLKDAHGVALKQPITVAFGTGPTINRGALRGRILAAADGQPAAAADVFAFSADSLGAGIPDRLPDYRTQTDDRGNFALTYLREGPYVVLGVRDANGNRRADPAEWLAVPPQATVSADSAGSALPRPWVLSRIDTLRPAMLQASARSSRELEIRFSEAVLMGDTSTEHWELADSLSGERRQISLMYADENPRSIVLRIDSLADRTHRLSGYASIADSSGNRMETDTLYFSPSSSPFQQEASFAGFSPDSLVATASGYFRLWPATRAGIRFRTSPGSEWADRIAVTDTLGSPFAYTPITRDGVLFELFGDEINQPIDVSVLDADTTHTRRFMRAGTSATGDIGGAVRVGTRNESATIELIRDGTDEPVIYRTRSDDEGNFLFTGLPGGSRYLVRAFLDRNGDGSWSPGSVFPYAEPEPIGWSLVEEPVRARWETVLPDTLTIPFD